MHPIYIAHTSLSLSLYIYIWEVGRCIQDEIFFLGKVKKFNNGEAQFSMSRNNMFV